MQSDLRQAGSDPKVFTALYQQYYRRVFKYLCYRCDSAATAEDLTALVFEKILQSLPRYQAREAPVEAWIFTITANCFRDWYRRQKYVSWLSWDQFLRQPAPQPGPEESLQIREEVLALQRALKTLSERERSLIAWRFGAQLSNRQIAALSHLSEQNIAVILFRALRKLHKTLSTSPEVKHATE